MLTTIAKAIAAALAAPFALVFEAGRWVLRRLAPAPLPWDDCSPTDAAEDAVEALRQPEVALAPTADQSAADYSPAETLIEWARYALNPNRVPFPPAMADAPDVIMAWIADLDHSQVYAISQSTPEAVHQHINSLQFIQGVPSLDWDEEHIANVLAHRQEPPPPQEVMDDLLKMFADDEEPALAPAF